MITHPITPACRPAFAPTWPYRPACQLIQESDKMPSGAAHHPGAPARPTTIPGRGLHGRFRRNPPDLVNCL